MKYSFSWLQEHLDQPLPDPKRLCAEMTIKAFEVEAMETRGADTVFDIKVLPDRAHDALSHRGMAREVAALFDIPMRERINAELDHDRNNSRTIHIDIKETTHCHRYIGARVDRIVVGSSPKWLTTKLESIDARSINNIVDITNFILFDLGQPMHAFDADKIVGGITVRLAKRGETMITLDGKELIFDGTELLIADDEGPLALAGVKGGKRAEVDAHTTSIILESANFDPVSIRRSSTKHHIKTDASKRFENGMTSALASEAMEHALMLTKKLIPEAIIGAPIDVYPITEEMAKPVIVGLSELNGLLGITMSLEDVRRVLERLTRAGFSYELTHDTATVIPPQTRLDIRIQEDVIEEIGRHIGYDNITPTLPALPQKGVPNKRLYYANKARDVLIRSGYSEVFTYSFAPKGEGEVEAVNPVGKDRPFLRSSLRPGIERALRANLYYLPLLEIDDVKIFEFGNVFTKSGERMMLAVGAMAGTKKRWKELKEEFGYISKELRKALVGEGEGTPNLSVDEGNSLAVFEIDFDAFIADLPMPQVYEPIVSQGQTIAYRAVSPYPFIVRDVALWVPLETNAQDVEKVIRTNAGDLAQKIYQFDTFEKDGRKSLAFRIVLQSFERTLEDAEANAIYNNVVKALQETHREWQVRV